MSPSTVLLRLRRLVGPSQDAEETDGQILERFLTLGDELAFEMLLERHGPMVLGVCRRLLHDPHQIDDAFQATFLVLVRKAGSIARRESVGSWLHGVARRVALRVRGRSARQQACEKARAEMIASKSAAEPARDDISSVLDEEVQRLPPKYRTALVLCYLEGKTNEEAARQLGCPPGTTFTRLSRGREMPRGRLVRRGVVVTSTALTAVALGVETASAAVPSALRVATIHEAMQAAVGKVAGSSAVSAVVEDTVREIGTVHWKALGGVLLTLATLGGVTAALTITGAPPEADNYRAACSPFTFTITCSRRGFAWPRGRDCALPAACHAACTPPSRNTTVLDEAGCTPPLTRRCWRRPSRTTSPAVGRERVVLLFAGRAAVVRGQAYPCRSKARCTRPTRCYPSIGCTSRWARARPGRRC